ncbi:efflux transporter outer membrane subunit [Sphingomonas abaci]|uniref:NodT family efflux transporter outer membrane factor (OMF) lipoprotein n=1 Tax=Sphingomonas abaci TaxID=237611 RepID=A0A7W7AM74_9SPHN|nr:efflux transporter outer membrane subunit [Sphingomonas abaci]MBB4619585.1 NodT family efflux transporter outer membrane factor (OMF) lipoprotein [Sphingomonas abaci]
MKITPLLPLLGLLAACTVGPDYAGPPATASDAATRGRFVRATDPAFVPTPGLARWWETLNDPTLTALVDDALAHNPSIDQAQARIREALARITQQRSGQLPGVSANATYVHAEVPGIDLGGQSGGQGGGGDSGGGGSTSLQFYNLGLNVGWEADIFGGGRRGIEQSRRTAEARFADLADAQVSLSAQVAQAYVSLRDVQARIRLNQQSTALQQRQLALTRQRFAAGTASTLDVERLQTALETSEAQAVPLGAQRDEYLGQIAILTGRAPGALDATLSTVAPVPLPPAQVPVGDPAMLIASRPDIRSAERQLAAATAGIGVSKARELPAVRFLGLLGLGGTSPGDVFDLGKLTALGAPTLSWSFLDFGKARAATRASEAQRDQAEAGYRQTVLQALQEAETSLSRFGNLRAQLGNLARAEAAAARAATLNDQRVRAGTSATIDQLDIERQRLSAAIAVAQAKAQLTTSYIAVQKSLGLGWTPQRADAVPPAR